MTDSRSNEYRIIVDKLWALQQQEQNEYDHLSTNVKDSSCGQDMRDNIKWTLDAIDIINKILE